MGHIGNTVQTAFTSFDKQTITGTGGTTYTLTHSVANEREIEVFVNNVRQEPSVAYNVSGNTLTMTGNVASTDDFYVVFQGKAVQTVTHPSDQPMQATTGTFSGTVTANAFSGDGTGVTNAVSVAVIADQKAYNVNGGGSDIGFNDRDLNTTIFDPDNIVTISSNQFTLNAGTYIIEFSSFAFRSNRTFTELYDVTNSASAGQGMTVYHGNADNVAGVSTGYTRVTPSVSTTYKIRTYCQASKTTNGLGVAHDVSGNNNIYTQVKITKIA